MNQNNIDLKLYVVLKKHNNKVLSDTMKHQIIKLTQNPILVRVN